MVYFCLVVWDCYATLFLSFSSMIGIGLREWDTIPRSETSLFIIGISAMTGIGAMFIPKEVLGDFPSIVVPIMNNGLILGVIIAIGLEQGNRLKYYFSTLWTKAAQGQKLSR
jgi:xanthine/uracil permease